MLKDNIAFTCKVIAWAVSRISGVIYLSYLPLIQPIAVLVQYLSYG